MQQMRGSFSAHVSWQTTIPQNETPKHDVTIVQIAGVQKSSDALWNSARIAYWGLGETISGNGTQRGYFIDRHADGSMDRGTFEAQVTTTGNDMTLQGTFTFSGGTGKFNGLTGGGTFRTRMTSPTELECTWEGAYQLAETGRGAGR
jgi:hypothetical protein